MDLRHVRWWSGRFAAFASALLVALAVPGAAQAQTGTITGRVIDDASQQPVAKPAFKSGKLYFPVAIDTESRTTARYGVRRVPTVFVVGVDGKIRAVWEGLPSKKVLLKVLAAK